MVRETQKLKKCQKIIKQDLNLIEELINPKSD